MIEKEEIRETTERSKAPQEVGITEEMIAEVGASFLMADLGLACAPRPDHAAYVVNRRSIGTPYRRAKGTPLQLRGLVDAGRVFRAAGGVGRA